MAAWASLSEVPGARLNERGGRHLPVVVDAERTDLAADGGDGVERDRLAVAGAQVELGENLGLTLELAADLHDDVVLVGRRVDGGYLAGAVGAVRGCPRSAAG